MSENHDAPGEDAEDGGAACAGMEWCEPEASRTADTAEAKKNADDAAKRKER